MNWAWMIVVGAIYLAIIVALVKPDSPVAGAVNGISTAFATLVATATGNNAPNNSPVNVNNPTQTSGGTLT